jgi:hypothetical protein
MSHEHLEVEKGFSLSGLKDSVVGFVHTQLNRLERKVEKNVLNPVNNYLKTPEEIEADLSLQVNFQGVVLAVEMEQYFIRTTAHKDGYINIHDPEVMNQGFMEENY